MREVIAVSACLLGYNCKYNGKNNFNPKLVKQLKDNIVLPICPEEFGGMTTPRIPSEIQKDGRILNEIGQDVSCCFQRGLLVTLEMMRQHQSTKAILKDGSPSCGFTQIYDGTFTNTKMEGMGVTAKHLLQNGVTILNMQVESALR
ncbi:MAG: hypothetical protein CVV56_08910 [Tenericutes bacterium HGW-Tenericutes-1]|jgi:uncharacterized protein YbbK (DUF523 family)|nr:MAG: hypothetical protein CVV56_08910 [Tenericutes bacterium HGW-Tenericutes-1]